MDETHPLPPDSFNIDGTIILFRCLQLAGCSSFPVKSETRHSRFPCSYDGSNLENDVPLGFLFICPFSRLTMSVFFASPGSISVYTP